MSFSSQYNDRGIWMAQGMNDGESKIGWASKENAPFPHTFTYELDTEHQIHSVFFDTRNTEEMIAPGISARLVEVYVSERSIDGPYIKVFEGDLPKQDISAYKLSKSAKARYIKLEVIDNWGNPKWTEIMEFGVFGESVGERRSPSNFFQPYQTTYDTFQIGQKNDELLGCYDFDNGIILGARNGRLLEADWFEDKGKSGKAVFIFSEDSSVMNGFWWWSTGEYGGAWFGSQLTSADIPRCATKLEDYSGRRIGVSLEKFGKAVLYGLYFDTASAELDQRSTVVLNQLVEWLDQSPSMRIQLIGHTDSVGEPRDNQNLSDARARAVADWLIQKGISNARLLVSGRGELEPTASNESAQGRSLNRRVEISVVR